MDQIKNLLQNGWIKRCEGAWGSMIVLAAKPHQEHVNNIDDFIWRMCVSYRKLNSITKPFQFPIPRCDDSIISLEQGPGTIYQIAMDADSGYHQIGVRAEDQEKLAFFAPDHFKYTWNVMPFGPCNAPPFYTAMMSNFKEEWDTLFLLTVQELEVVADQRVTVDGTCIHLGKDQLYYGSRTIIDDILIWTSHLQLTVVYFRCVCRVFQKYRVSFKLKKCDFLKERTEYVGYDVLSSGNSPAQSKFDMINDWPVPSTGQSLHSFIGLINFYHRFAPYLEIRLKPLRKICKQFFRKAIPQLTWTAELIQLFQDLKVSITSGPILARYDPSKPTFLKTDWSAEGMGWILMQPADDEESVRATEVLKTTGKCLFDLCKNGARLRPIAFGSRACSDMERKLHSFLGEVASGRWAIGQNRRFLWGCFFYWLCDCSAVKEVLEYEGSISYVCRWAQELLGYHFCCVHRSNRMMADVDSLTRRYGKPLAQYLAVSYMLKQGDKERRPAAYDPKNFDDAILKKLPHVAPAHNVITESTIQHVHLFEEPPNAADNSSAPCLVTAPLRIQNVHAASPVEAQDQFFRAFHDLSEISGYSLVIDGPFDQPEAWVQDFTVSTRTWTIHQAFTTENFARLHTMFNRNATSFAIAPEDFSKLPIPLSQYELIDWTCTTSGCTGIDWLRQACNHLQPLFTSPSKLAVCTFWLSSQHVQSLTTETTSKFIRPFVPSTWWISCTSETSAKWGDGVDVQKWLIIVARTPMDYRVAIDQVVPVEPRGMIDCIGSVTVSPTNLVPNLQIPAAVLEDLQESDLYKPRIVGIIGKDVSTVATSSMILDPMFPAREPSSAHQRTPFFNQRFGIATQHDDSITVIKPSNSDMLKFYSILYAPAIVEHLTQQDLDESLRLTTPCRMKAALWRAILIASKLAETTIYGSADIREATSCYFIKQSPETLDWAKEYAQDPSTSTMLEGFKVHQGKSWTTEELGKIHKSFHRFLKDNTIILLRGKLVLLKAIFQNKQHINLIIVPTNIRRKLFAHYHSGPTGGHMGEYKTLFRLRLRFFWPSMRSDIKQWIKGCPQCIQSNLWRNKRNELYFSWPVTSPFYILHVDLWQPGKLADSSNNSIYLFNCMCDLTQFVVSSLVKNPDSAELARIFMEQVVLNYGLCSVVVVDADSKFKSIFEEMCHKLKILFWPLARGNHKGLSVEKYHRFLNKTQTIVGQERGTHLSILQNGKLSQYAWNSAPIDNTDVTRSMAALGREFRFPLDVELSPTPSLNDCQNTTLYNYLRSMSNNSSFAAFIIQILAEDRRTAHRERINATKTQQKFQIGDAVTARVTVQSQTKTNTVKKLSYQARGPFQIIAILDADSYEVQRYGQPDSAKRKYKGTDLFLLPPAIFPNDPLDTTDCRYLNFEHLPIPSTSQQPFQVDMYNDTFFSKTGDQHKISHPKAESPIVSEAAPWHEHLPTIENMNSETQTTPPQQAPSEPLLDPIPDSPHLLASINNSKDKVFFIKYLPEGTMRPKWYPVQIDLESTQEVNPQFAKTNHFWCVFLAKHPDDSKKSDEFARWWPDWYEYSTNKETEQLIFGQRVLFRPNVIPPSDTYVQWAELIYLSPENILFGPCNFQSTPGQKCPKNTFAKNIWKHVRSACQSHNLLPPILGPHSSHRIKFKSPTQSSRKRKQSNSTN